MILLNSRLTPTMSLTDMPSVPVVQLHSAMSEVDALEVVKDELYHDGMKVIQQWLGLCKELSSDTTLHPPKRLGERIVRLFNAIRLFGAFVVKHVRHIYAVLTMMAFVEGF
jgi:hypothetical protein